MDFKRKILLLGGSSYVGRNIVKAYNSNGVVATYHSQPIDSGVHFDALSMELADIVENPSIFSHAFVLLGDTKPDSCAMDPQKSRLLNVVSIERVIDQLNDWGVKPVFFSSEYVFDGQKGNYTELDEPKPVLLYGKQKLEIEKYIQSKCRNYLIIRLSKTYGSTLGDNTLLTNWMANIQGKSIIKCAADQVFSPVYIDDVVKSAIRLTEGDFNGIFHVSGNKAFKRIELLEMLLNCIKRRTQLNIRIIPCSIHDFKSIEKWPLNVSMIPRKLVESTGIMIANIEDICTEIAERNF